jgi:hypothetical protein
METELNKAKQDRNNLSNRCQTLLENMNVKEKRLKEAASSQEKKVENHNGGCAVTGDGNVQDELKELKRRLSQRQSLINALKSKDRVRENEFSAMTQKIVLIEEKLKKHQSGFKTYSSTSTKNRNIQ